MRTFRRGRGLPGPGDAPAEPGLRWLLEKRADALEDAWHRGEVRATRTFALLRLGSRGRLDPARDAGERPRRARTAYATRSC